MAVEEVRKLLMDTLTLLDHTRDQEFSIEIPDTEADEIKTVQQGMSLLKPIVSGANCCHHSHRLHCEDTRR